MIAKSIWIGLLAFVAYCLLKTLWPAGLDKASLVGKSVLVTGASRGIGEQIAYIYATSGANVFITARSERELKRVLEKCKSLSPASARHSYHVTDMGKAVDRIRLVQAALAHFNHRLDYLVLNHGTFPVDTFKAWNGSDADIDDIQHTMEVNFISFTHLSALFYPALREKRGRVGVVGSIGGRIPAPYWLSYAASKFAIDGYFSGLRREMEIDDTGVSFTHLILGKVHTPKGDKFRDNFQAIYPYPSILSLIPGARAEDAAMAIVISVEQREKEVTYPWYQGITISTVLRHILPFDIF